MYYEFTHPIVFIVPLHRDKGVNFSVCRLCSSSTKTWWRRWVG